MATESLRKRRYLNNPTGMLLILFFCTLFLRFPYFFKETISWDEHTFMLMGQSVLDGHLPYTKLWDLKPLSAFLSYALFIAAFGNSIVAVRFAGTLCVTAIAFLVLLTGQKHQQQPSGLIAALLCIVLISITPYGQATMTETVALVPLLSAFYILSIYQSLTVRKTFAAGFLLAVAALIRLNLLYVSLAIGLLIPIFLLRQKLPLRQILYRQAAYVLGHVTVFMLTLVPYLHTGTVDVWWQSMVVATLSYAGSPVSDIQTSAPITLLLEMLYILACLLPLVGLAYALGKAMRSPLSLGRRFNLVTAVFFCAVTLSILRSGSLQNHYLIQLAPFLSLFLGQKLAKLGAVLKGLKGAQLWGWVSAIALMLLPLTTVLILAYQPLVNQAFLAQAAPKPSVSRRIADYLIHQRGDDDLIYMVDDHLVYLWVAADPITPCSTHPSNIVKAYLLPYCAADAQATPQSEMAKILALQPRFIVKKAGIPWYLENEPEVWQLLADHLRQTYQLVEVIASREIYERH